jgi:drug/metabolite transporter (DMT)-like permease
MIYLVFSIVATSLIFVIFKLFSRFEINTFQAIVVNYFTASSLGIILFGNTWNHLALYAGNWPFFAVIAGVLFISLFLVLGISSQRNGIAITSIAVKMSMAMTVLFMIFLYNESISFLKIAGITCAFSGVLLMAYQKANSHREKSNIWMLFFLFIGGAFLDLVLNYVQKYELTFLTSSLFSAFGFGFAGAIGAAIVLFQVVIKKKKIQGKSLLAGLILGIPNYFSIYWLMEAYRATGWSDSTVLVIMNVSTVLLAIIIGFVIFQESLNQRKFAGVVASLVAIALLYLAS